MLLYLFPFRTRIRSDSQLEQTLLLFVAFLLFRFSGRPFRIAFLVLHCEDRRLGFSCFRVILTQKRIGIHAVILSPDSYDLIKMHDAVGRPDRIDLDPMIGIAMEEHVLRAVFFDLDDRIAGEKLRRFRIDRILRVERQNDRTGRNCAVTKEDHLQDRTCAQLLQFALLNAIKSVQTVIIVIASAVAIIV